MPSVEPASNGPLLVSGVTGLVRMRDGATLPCSGTVALCRCGGSSNKPFCDGTHGTNGFSDAKDPDREPDRRDTYVGKQITVFDNRGLCAHAGRCTDGLPQVFGHPNPEGGFADPDAATRDEIIAVIKQCPSGALSYAVDGVEHRERGGPPFVGVAPNGPYVFKGGCELKGVTMPQGGTLDHFDLCRCGRSSNKPFCSGAHWYVHFDKEVPPPEDAE